GGGWRRRLAAVGFLSGAKQLIEADRLLEPLLADAELARRGSLWRLAAEIASARGLTARHRECLERALDAEYRDLPEVINAQRVNEDYAALLAHYENPADPM